MVVNHRKGEFLHFLYNPYTPIWYNSFVSLKSKNIVYHLQMLIAGIGGVLVILQLIEMFTHWNHPADGTVLYLLYSLPFFAIASLLTVLGDSKCEDCKDAFLVFILIYLIGSPLIAIQLPYHIFILLFTAVKSLYAHLV